MAARTVTAKRFPPSPGDSRALASDPRDYQVAALSTLLVLGKLAFDFDVSWLQVGVTLVAALACQWLAPGLGRRTASPASRDPRPPFEWKSALISGLSLCLLLRTRVLAWAGLAAIVAVASKFVLRLPRAGGGTKHLLNPTNGAIVLLLLCGAPVWVSPGQWGHHLPLAFGVAGFGSLVVHRSARSDVALAFLAAWAAILFGRAAWLGQPWVAPLHQFESGSLALFAFHMISDPKTTPDSRAGRIVFGCFVAAGAAVVQFALFRTNGLLWSLASCSLFVPWLDRWLPGRGFEWSAPGTGAQLKENHHAQSGVRIPAGAAGGVRTA